MFDIKANTEYQSMQVYTKKLKTVICYPTWDCVKDKPSNKPIDWAKWILHPTHFCLIKHMSASLTCVILSNITYVNEDRCDQCAYWQWQKRFYGKKNVAKPPGRQCHRNLQISILMEWLSLPAEKLIAIRVFKVWVERPLQHVDRLRLMKIIPDI